MQSHPFSGGGALPCEWLHSCPSLATACFPLALAVSGLQASSCLAASALPPALLPGPKGVGLLCVCPGKGSGGILGPWPTALLSFVHRSGPRFSLHPASRPHVWCGLSKDASPPRLQPSEQPSVSQSSAALLWPLSAWPQRAASLMGKRQVRGLDQSPEFGL